LVQANVPDQLSTDASWIQGAQEMRANEFIFEDDEPVMHIRVKGPSEKSKQWVADVKSKFYQEGNNSYIFWNHENNIIPLGKEETKDIAAYVQFELVPKQQNAVEVKWIQATPLGSGYGAKGMKILQDLAQQSGISLTLFPWNKGVVPQSKLIKFYKNQGFTPINKGSKDMVWKPKLDESLSRVVYHYTGIYPALKILTSGEFELSSTLGSGEQQYSPKGYDYFLSTTRTKTGGYHAIVGSSAVLFVLDGNYYNQKYPSKSLDYWGNRDPAQSYGRSHEAEDRLFSKTPSIPIAGVTALHVLVKKDAEPHTKAYARKVMISAKQQGIAAYLYDDEKAWRSLNTAQTVSVGLLKGQESQGRNGRRHRGYLMPWMEVLQAKELSQLSNKGRGIVRQLRRSLENVKLGYKRDRDEVARSLDSEMSNARRPNSGADREHVVKIISFMRKNKLQTTTDLIDLLSNKWEESLVY